MLDFPLPKPTRQSKFFKSRRYIKKGSTPRYQVHRTPRMSLTRSKKREMLMDEIREYENDIGYCDLGVEVGIWKATEDSECSTGFGISSSVQFTDEEVIEFAASDSASESTTGSMSASPDAGESGSDSSCTFSNVRSGALQLSCCSDSQSLVSRVQASKLGPIRELLSWKRGPEAMCAAEKRYLLEVLDSLREMVIRAPTLEGDLPEYSERDTPAYTRSSKEVEDHSSEGVVEVVHLSEGLASDGVVKEDLSIESEPFTPSKATEESLKHEASGEDSPKDGALSKNAHPGLLSCAGQKGNHLHSLCHASSSITTFGQPLHFHNIGINSPPATFGTSEHSVLRSTIQRMRYTRPYLVQEIGCKVSVSRNGRFSRDFAAIEPEYLMSLGEDTFGLCPFCAEIEFHSMEVYYEHVGAVHGVYEDSVTPDPIEASFSFGEKAVICPSCYNAVEGMEYTRHFHEEHVGGLKVLEGCLKVLVMVEESAARIKLVNLRRTERAGTGAETEAETGAETGAETEAETGAEGARDKAKHFQATKGVSRDEGSAEGAIEVAVVVEFVRTTSPGLPHETGEPAKVPFTASATARPACRPLAP